MTIYRITYLDKYERKHVVELPADDTESAITNLEDLLEEEVEVKKIEILEDES